MSWWTTVGDGDLYDADRRHEVSVEEDVCGGYNPEPSRLIRVLVIPSWPDDRHYDVRFDPAGALDLARRLIEAAHRADPSLTVPGAVVAAIEDGVTR